MLIEGLTVTKPTTPTEWLMMCVEDEPPFDDTHNTIVAEAIGQLSDESKFILMAVFYERIAYEELGARLGVSKTHAWRLTNKAKNELRELLAPHPHLQRRYKLFTTWDDACLATVESFTRWVKAPPNDTAKWAREQLLENWQFDVEPTTATYFPLARWAWQRISEDATNESVASKLIAKQHDYGHDNILSFGHRGIIVRLIDKLARLDNLLSKGADPENESLQDTYLDIFGYCTIGTMLADDTFKLPLKEDAQ